MLAWCWRCFSAWRLGWRPSEQASASERATQSMMLFWEALVLAAVAVLAMVVRLVRS